MFSILMLIAGLSLHFGKTAKTQTEATIREYLLEADLSRSSCFVIAPEIRKATEGTGRPFPLVHVFTTDGKLIFQEDGYMLGMRGRMEDAFQKRQPIAGGISLKEELAQMRTFDGKNVEFLDLPTATFIIVDHWAVWCAACKPQMRRLESIASDNKDKTITILKVNWDEIKE